MSTSTLSVVEDLNLLQTSLKYSNKEVFLRDVLLEILKRTLQKWLTEGLRTRTRIGKKLLF